MVRKSRGPDHIREHPFKEAVMEDLTDVCGDKFGYTELAKLATKFSDGIILEDPNVDPSIVEYAKANNIPVLDYVEGDAFKDAYDAFYETVMGGEE